MQVKQISPSEAKNQIENGSILLDVRELDEVEQLACDVQNILIMPMSELQENYTQLPKDKEIITVCYSGARSYRVAEFLMYQGYEKVSNMSGGILGWQMDGFPLK